MANIDYATAKAVLRPLSSDIKNNCEVIFKSNYETGLNTKNAPAYGNGSIADGTKELGYKYFCFLLDNYLTDSVEARLAFDVFEKEHNSTVH